MCKLVTKLRKRITKWRKRITSQLVPAHLDTPQKVAAALLVFPIEVIIGNHVADALASRGAAAAAVPAEAAYAVKTLRAKAAAILRRAT
eukprot:13300580-Heterocapsa_arctica.AAC.1